MLIIVIGLLVLMAIIGTAYISTARVDRTAAAANAYNTEAVLQLNGAEEMAISQIINDINPVTGTGITKYRTATGGVYTPYNSAVNDQWLSDRVPAPLDPTQSFSAASNPAIWHYIGVPPGTATANVFSDPTTGATYGGTGVTPINATASRCYYAPNWEQYTYTNSSGQAVTLQLPTLSYYDYNSSSKTGTWVGPYIAADTDGDGVADAGLFRMPCGEINGVTYYAAYRIIDNAAAVNAAVAWAPQAISNPQSTSTNPPAVPGNFYPTNVDLNDLICTGDSMSNFNQYRFNTGPSLTPSFGAGYSYDTVYDAAWHELGRRLQNPASNKYTAVGLSDMADLAHRFVVRDPNAAQSSLEYYLGNSVYNNAPTTSYLPTSSANYSSELSSWYQTNFNYAIGNQGATAGYATSLRPLLVTRNGVTNFTANKYGPNAGATTTTNTALPGGSWPAPVADGYSTYYFGDWVTYNNHAYVCIQPTPSSSGATPSTSPVAGSNYYSDSPNWVYEPWANAPVKTNVNTATFGQLWLAYWNVMCDPTNGQNAAFNMTLQNSEQQAGANMFRSSLRYPSSPVPGTAYAALSATQELQLRAAIAATNTLDLRNTSLATSNTAANVIPTVEPTSLYSSSGAPLQIENYASGSPTPQYGAVIYGNKPQPFITEVYADNDPTLVNGTLGYVAIELYNPYPYPITLTNWVLVTIPRPNSPTNGTPLSATPISSTVTGWASGASATTLPTIPANGFCVLANGATPAGYSTPPTATVGSATDPLYVVPGLEAALGNDLVLMRPTVNKTYATGATDAGDNDLNTAAPVDSYDFTGLKTLTTFTAGAAGAGCYEWTYFRDTTLPWHCVYPGPFSPTQGGDALHPRFLGTNAPLAIANAGTPATTSLAFLGAQHINGSGYVGGGQAYVSMPIQLNNVDFGGPIKLASSGNYFPFGEFARNADIMEVPYIGAYKIYDSTGTNLLEMNPITLDSAYAAQTVPVGTGDETDEANTSQNIGRFAPWWDVDYLPLNGTGTGSGAGWTTQLMDYLTVQAPSDDYAPDTDPLFYPAGTAAITAVANANPNIVNAIYTKTVTEDTVPIQGLININTAPWRVLATLPFSDDPNTNAAVAQAIVNYRDGYWSITNGTYTGAQGPYKNVFDLNLAGGPSNWSQTGITTGTNVSFFETLGSYNNSGVYANAFAPASPNHAPTNNDGMITPNYAYATANGWPTSSGVNNDFQNWNLALARVSNLITTRSDSYTVYVLVQGWANAGKANAQLVVQRRAAFIVDRSGTTPTNPTVSISNVSTN